jgi:hypothetical protein
MRKLLSTLMSVGMIFTGVTQVSQAHTLPPLPLHHAGLLVRPILPINHSTSAFQLSLLLGRGGVPGVSGATSAFLLRNKVLTVASYQNGMSSAVVNQLVQTPGVIYFRDATSNAYLSQGAPSVDAFGSNPLNTGGNGTNGATSIVNIPNFQSLVLNFPPGVSHQKGIAFGIKPVYLSGALRAFSAQDKAIGLQASGLGAKTILSMGPLTGGRLFGAEYFQSSGKVYDYYSQVGYSFGSDPYATPSLPVLFSNGQSFLTFADGQMLNVSSAQLFFTRYIQNSGTVFGDFGGRFFAIGSNPFNVHQRVGSYTPTTVPNFLNYFTF